MENSIIRRRALAAGAAAYLQKPFDDRRLLEVLDQGLEYRSERPPSPFECFDPPLTPPWCNARWKMAPPLGPFSAQSRPRCAVAMDRQIARPRPRPCSLVVKNASKICSSRPWGIPSP